MPMGHGWSRMVVLMTNSPATRGLFHSCPTVWSALEDANRREERKQDPEPLTDAQNSGFADVILHLERNTGERDTYAEASCLSISYRTWGLGTHYYRVMRVSAICTIREWLLWVRNMLIVSSYLQFLVSISGTVRLFLDLVHFEFRVSGFVCVFYGDWWGWRRMTGPLLYQ